MSYNENLGYQTFNTIFVDKPSTDSNLKKIGIDAVETVPKLDLYDLIATSVVTPTYLNESKFKISILSDLNIEEFTKMITLVAITKELSLPHKSIGIIEKAITKVKNDLIRSNISIDINPSLYVDAEDSNWKELKLTIPLDKEKYTSKLEYEIIQGILNNMDENLGRQTIVNISLY